MNYLVTIGLLLSVVGHTVAQPVSAQTVAYQPATPAAPATSTSATNPLSQLTEDADRKAEFVDRLLNDRSYLDAQIIDKCFTFRLSPGCWEQFAEPVVMGGQSGLGAAYQWGRYVLEYSKREHMGNLMAMEASDPNVERQNRPMMDQLIEGLRKRFSLTISMPVACTGKGYDLMTRYTQELMERIGRTLPAWSPKSGEAHFTVTLSATAKDITLTVSPDGRQFTLLAPAYADVLGSAEKIATALEQANKNQ
jgi:hypothetical protein